MTLNHSPLSLPNDTITCADDQDRVWSGINREAAAFFEEITDTEMETGRAYTMYLDHFGYVQDYVVDGQLAVRDDVVLVDVQELVGITGYVFAGTNSTNAVERNKDLSEDLSWREFYKEYINPAAYNIDSSDNGEPSILAYRITSSIASSPSNTMSSLWIFRNLE